MSKHTPRKQTDKRQPAQKRLPFRRAKHLRLRLTRRRTIVITLRKFRTAKANRAKTFRQLVVPLYLLPVKELAIKQQKKSRRTRSKSKPRRQLDFQTAFTAALLVVGMGGTLYFGTQLAQQRLSTPQATAGFDLPAPVSSMEKVGDSEYPEPARVRIPKIGIDTGVMRVGRENDGAMEVPPLGREITGWYRYSPGPGEIGPAVIVGHIDSEAGPSVFWHLDRLKPGDFIEVTREDGEELRFQVVGVEQFEQDTFPTEKVYGDIDYAGLRLITCGGDFDWRRHRYSHNTVVFATLVAKDKTL